MVTKVTRSALPVYQSTTELAGEGNVFNNDVAFLTEVGKTGTYRYDSTSNLTADDYAVVKTGPGQWLRENYPAIDRDESINGAWEFTDRVLAKDGGSGGLGFINHSNTYIRLTAPLEVSTLRFDVDSNEVLTMTTSSITAEKQIKAESDLTFDAHGFNDLPIGTRRPPHITMSGNGAIVANSEQTVIEYTGTASSPPHSLTTSGVGGEGKWVIVMNTSSNALTISEGSGTMKWVSEAGIQTGDRTLAVGGVITIYYKGSTGRLVYGGGIS
jgi:hypothetical protein